MMLYFYHRRYSFTAAEFFPLDLTILLSVRLLSQDWESYFLKIFVSLSTYYPFKSKKEFVTMIIMYQLLVIIINY